MGRKAQTAPHTEAGESASVGGSGPRWLSLLWEVTWRKLGTLAVAVFVGLWELKSDGMNGRGSSRR